ncbi:FG-GAP repeat domain-containing protein [Flavihumibacter profundi]|uniref:FG-GAP repeat domain-containing protein n=1 Tax=Flavihumibacter profundi TaxID=2716883 RepID=UPI001CC3B30A|nr:VCBS repeat-containing protein [Flavihumibacter profundi]MBZ5858317.1 VCBS repeat-containing protein [Flavihumibacter profundi]
MLNCKYIILSFFFQSTIEMCFSQQAQVNTIQPPVHFRMQKVSTETYESVGVFDVDGDGQQDLVSGGFWYKGPEYIKRFPTRDVKRTGEYFDDFFTIPLDVNGDGRMDYISGGWFGGTIYWYENTGKYDENWPEHIIAQIGNLETARAWDVDGDGIVEIVPNNLEKTFRFYRLDLDAKGKGKGSFAEHKLFDTQGHGLGFGDVNNDGRSDFVLADGWLEAPKKPLAEPWKWHPEFHFDKASIPILVVDLNKDGHNDLIVGNGHGYGLYWYEQGQGGKWIKHDIDPNNAQFHTMAWADITGDNIPELLTGKRFRAHNDHDPGAYDDYGLYYYQWNGEAFSKQVINYGALGFAKGTGNFFTVTDLNADGRPDWIVAGKDGLCIFYNEGVNKF